MHNIKLASAILIAHCANKILHSFSSNSSTSTPNSVIFILFGKLNKKSSILTCSIVSWLFFINFLLIAIFNPSLLNPGPGLSVYYQNVQGLVPFGSLRDEHPPLNDSKILELNSYIYQCKPDIVVLNETWLKKSILDSEILDNNNYKIFRCDRTDMSHPPDPINKDKFKRNGGGVLIAVKTELDVTSKEIRLEPGAEIIAIKLTLSNGTKLIFSTCYRVGTLGHANHISIEKSLRSVFLNHKNSKIFVMGDLNLSDIHWPLDENYSPSNTIEGAFIDTFNELGMTQCINSSTHIKGKTLDIVLTSHESNLQDIEILEHNVVCKSDHFPITFNVKTQITRKKSCKRKIYNFKRANWDALNYELRQTNWKAMLDSYEPKLAWCRFKTKLFELVNKYIPKIVIKSEFKPPWFDSELYHLCRKKERCRKNINKQKKIAMNLNLLNVGSLSRNLLNKKCVII